MDAYEQLARYYDLENADFTEDLPFWLSLAAERGEPIVELGCGTGRVLLQLAREGYHVAGVDRSPAMLARARSRLAQSADLGERVQLHEQDFTHLDLGQRYALAILPFNTFAHLLTAEEQTACLRGLARHLQPGGWVVMDLPNAPEVYSAPPAGMVLERTFRDEPLDLTIQQFSTLTVDRSCQLGHVTWIYDQVDASGRVQRTTVAMTLRYCFPAEMAALLELCGLKLVSLYGDFQRGPYEDGAERMIVVGERPPAAQGAGERVTSWT